MGTARGVPFLPRTRPFEVGARAARPRGVPEIVIVGAPLEAAQAAAMFLVGLPDGFELPVVLVMSGAAEDNRELCTRLQAHCALPVRQIDDKDPILSGRIHLAPADYHVLVERRSFVLSTEGPVSGARPSIDVVLESAADMFGDGVVCVLLGTFADAERGGADGPAGAARCAGPRGPRDRSKTPRRRPRAGLQPPRPSPRGDDPSPVRDRALRVASRRRGAHVTAPPADDASILVVDDEPKNLLAVEAVLGAPGSAVAAARSGREALRHLLNRDFAVILLDVQMPDLDGFKTAAIIRQRDRCRHVPIIFLTEISKASEHVRLGYALGAVDYVFKPFEAEILRSKVNVFVELFRNREHVRRQAEQLRVLEERRRSAELLDSVRRQNELILNAVGEGICGFDADGRVVFVNPAACRLSGFRRDELMGQPGHALLHHTKSDGTHCSGEECDLYHVMRGRAARPIDGEILWRKDGTSIPIEGLGTLLSDGHEIVSVMVFRDVAERLQIERERSRLVRELEEAISARDDFLSIASHELRTPLTPIRLTVQRLKRRGQNPSAALPKSIAAQLETMDRQVGRLDTLINELLDVSRITVGRMDLELTEFDITALVREVVARFQQELEWGGHTVTLVLGPPAMGTWDRLRLDQVISNLLSNAMKYGGDRKRIEVGVADAGSTVEISIRDHGLGISPEDQERIFERFERLISVRHFGGFGLGLWIVRQIAEAHSGRVRVASVPGEGSTFTVEVPRVLTATAGRSPAGATHQSPSAAPVSQR